ncbi:radical SAM protein [bacterium]|nr:radical SAM protein [bacterium]
MVKFILIALKGNVVIVNSSKEIHGWWHPLKPYGRRECTSERLLLNPYIGCQHSCPFCYARTFPGYFEEWREKGNIFVFENFPQSVARQLDKLKIAACGYLSPVTDPFQPLEQQFHLSEQLVKVFVERNLPIEVITKGKITQNVMELLRKQKHSFIQVSILTWDENLRKLLVPRGASTETLLDNLRRAKEVGIYTVARLDPIFPYITDNPDDLRRLVRTVKEAGAKHIVGSVVDIPVKTRREVFSLLARIDKKLIPAYRELFQEKIGYSLHAKIDYRKKVFSTLRKICDEEGLTFALCMEFALTGREYEGKPVVEGLNKYFASSRNCEGIDVPIYVRNGDKFEPLNCDGACLICENPICGIEELAGGGAWRLSDYIRWSKRLVNIPLWKGGERNVWTG